MNGALCLYIKKHINKKYMNLQEFTNKKLEINQKISELKHRLYEIEAEYAISLAKFSIGYILQSRNSIILVDEISACKRRETDYLPTVIYRGKELTKRKTMRKDGRRNSIPEDSIINSDNLYILL